MIGTPPPPLAAVVLYAPAEVVKWDDLHEDEGWWVGAALQCVRPGDRLVVYRTRADRGPVGVFDAASEPFHFGELGWAAYGRPTPLAQTTPRSELLDDPVLRPAFKPLQRRRYLPKCVAQRLRRLRSLPVAGSSDPLPAAADPEWESTPTTRRWGSEVAVSDLLARDEDSWSTLGFASPPERERSPRLSLKRTDLKGNSERGVGIIVEVKHFVALSTLEQLRGYLTEARQDGRRWVGHLVALASYTHDVPRAVGSDPDVTLWVCERDSDGLPALKRVA